MWTAAKGTISTFFKMFSAGALIAVNIKLFGIRKKLFHEMRHTGPDINHGAFRNDVIFKNKFAGCRSHLGYCDWPQTHGLHDRAVNCVKAVQILLAHNFFLKQAIRFFLHTLQNARRFQYSVNCCRHRIGYCIQSCNIWPCK